MTSGSSFDAGVGVRHTESAKPGYWEPAKWVARLRANKTDSNTLLLRTNMGAGHGGSSGRHAYLREEAFRYAFILDQVRIAQP